MGGINCTHWQGHSGRVVCRMLGVFAPIIGVSIGAKNNKSGLWLVVYQSWTCNGSIHVLDWMWLDDWPRFLISNNCSTVDMLFFTNYDIWTFNCSGSTTIKSQHWNSQWHIAYEFDLIPDIYGWDWIRSAKWTHAQLWGVPTFNWVAWWCSPPNTGDVNIHAEEHPYDTDGGVMISNREKSV